MAKSVLDIIIRMIKEGGADKETVAGLVAVKKSILDAAAVGGTLLTAGYAMQKMFNESVGTLVAYADEVRRIQNATGASAEDSSKLIQILDDQKVSYEQLEKAVQKSGKAFDFSIAGIAKMSDEYLKLENSQQQAAFMQERFGKQWISFIPIMKQGGQAILDAAKAVDENLILTQKAVDQAREYEVSMDNLNDSVEGLKISMGQGLIPVTNQFLDGVNVLIRAQQIQIRQHISAKEAIAQATLEIANQKVALQQHKDVMEADNEATAESAEAAKASDAAFKEASAARLSMLGLISSIANEEQNFADKQTELTAKMAENRAEAEKLYPWQKQQLDELNQKYADMQTTYDQNAQAHAAAMGKIQYDLLITKLAADGFTEAEYAIAQQAGIMFGVFDQKSVDTAMNLDKITEAVNNGVLTVDQMKEAIDRLPEEKNIDVILNALVSIAGGAQAAYYQNGPTTKTKQTQQGGYAEGGIAMGPSSGHWELLHGNEAVIPLQNGSVPVALQGTPSGGGTSIVNVYLSVSTMMNNLDEQSTRNAILPYIINGIREAKARGAA